MKNASNNSEVKYNNLYVLGDSLSDSGVIIRFFNSLALLKNPFSESVKFHDPFYQGRSFTNGPTAVEHLAKLLGVKEFNPGWSYSLLPCINNEKHGQNYAVSNGSASQIPTPDHSILYDRFRLTNQLDTLIKHQPDIGERDLVVIMIGGNDLVYATTLDDSVKAERVLDQAVEEICNTLAALSEQSAKHVIVANGPDIGLIPAFNKNVEARDLATRLTENFNAKLVTRLEEVEKKYDNLEVKQFDLCSIMISMVNEYKNKGLNYQDACITNIADQASDQPLETLWNLLKGDLKSDYNPSYSAESLHSHFFLTIFIQLQSLMREWVMSYMN
ncbi:MAG: Lipase 1 [Wolbachia endosymbiont of Ctenocephalides orientis wCori]|nr:MAG: Lipase 1 [Wolbachia endosymbiont of Ctenocephalides orientis wCori]